MGHSDSYINIRENHCNQEAASDNAGYPQRRDPAFRVDSGAEPGPKLEEEDHVEGYDLQLQATEDPVASSSCMGKEYTLGASVH
jgi:hypothetical protein